MNMAGLAPPSAGSSRPESRPDFMRGFGVEIPEEEEPPEEEAALHLGEDVDAPEDADEDEEAERTHMQDQEVDMELEVEMDAETDIEADDEDGASTVAQSRMHSRHVSRLSAALSLVSVGRVQDDAPGLLGTEEEDELEMEMPVPADGMDTDAVEEWTGSEDFRTGQESSDDEVRDAIPLIPRSFAEIYMCRASVNGRIPLMKNVHGKLAYTSACSDGLPSSNATWRFLVVSLTSLAHLTSVPPRTFLVSPRQTTT